MLMMITSVTGDSTGNDFYMHLKVAEVIPAAGLWAGHDVAGTMGAVVGSMHGIAQREASPLLLRRQVSAPARVIGQGERLGGVRDLREADVGPSHRDETDLPAWCVEMFCCNIAFGCLLVHVWSKRKAEGERTVQSGIWQAVSILDWLFVARCLHLWCRCHWICDPYEAFPLS